MKRKVTRRVTEEVEIKTVEIEIPMDEIEEHTPAIPEALVNAFKTTARRNSTQECWRLRVDIDTGKIEGWPESHALALYCKPRDGGSYRLIGADGKVIAAIEQNYVPNLAIPGDYGDYIGLKIASNGVITNWLSAGAIDLCEFFKDEEDEE